MFRAPTWNMSAHLSTSDDLPRVHDLGDDRHAVLVADVAEDLQALLAHPLEGVGAASAA